MNRRTKARNLLLIAVLVASAILGFIPLVHAGSSLDCQGAGIGSLTATFNNSNNKCTPSAIGELIIVAITTQDTSVSACSGEIVPSTVTDTQGVVFIHVPGAPGCGVFNNANVGIADLWYGFTKSTAQDTVSTTLSGSVNEAWIFASYYTSSAGFALLAQGVAGCNGSNGSPCPATAQLSAPISYGAGNIVYGSQNTRSGTYSAPGASFSALNEWTGSANVASCSASGSAENCQEFFFPVAGATTTTPASLAGHPAWAVVGAVFGNPSTVFLVVACTFFQLQCWWYPTLFMGMYMAPFLAIGSKGRISTKGKTFLVLGGMVYGSLIEVIMGIMTILIPLLLIIVWVLYTFRFQLRQSFQGAGSVVNEARKKGVRSFSDRFKGSLATIFTLGIGGLAFALTALSPSAQALTVTITGWLAPDAVHLGNGLFALIYPFVGIGLFSGMAFGLGERGDILVTTTLLGQLVGSLLAMLSVTSSGTNAIPFAMLLIPGFSLALWLWEGGVSG